MAYGVSRFIAAPLLALNFCMNVIVFGIAAWAMNKIIDADSTTAIGNSATVYFSILALIASVVGAAATLSSLHHLKEWKSNTAAIATAPALISWALIVLALGFACKEIHIGGDRSHKLKTLEAFVIILGGTQLFYLLSIHGGYFSGEYSTSESYLAKGQEVKGGPAV
eukprot:c20857_g1_i1 orf=343-843(-)